MIAPGPKGTEACQIAVRRGMYLTERLAVVVSHKMPASPAAAEQPIPVASSLRRVMTGRGRILCFGLLAETGIPPAAISGSDPPFAATLGELRGGKDVEKAGCA